MKEPEAHILTSISQHFPQGCMISKASQHYKGTESREATPNRELRKYKALHAIHSFFIFNFSSM